MIQMMMRLGDLQMFDEYAVMFVSEIFIEMVNSLSTYHSYQAS
mgnify:CR=1 FL=1